MLKVTRQLAEVLRTVRQQLDLRDDHALRLDRGPGGSPQLLVGPPEPSDLSIKYGAETALYVSRDATVLLHGVETMDVTTSDRLPEFRRLIGRLLQADHRGQAVAGVASPER